MAFRLTPEAQKRVDEHREWHAVRERQFAAMTNENLVASAMLFMQHCEPRRYAPGEPVYDATLWHVIMPELMKRVRNQG